MAKLIWVDGPNASGKDYMIDGFIGKFKGKSIKVVRAAEFIMKGELSGNLRKYTKYSNELLELKRIYEGHINLLTELSYLLEEYDYVIVNRSFVSYYCYNLLSSLGELSEEDITDVINDYVNSYKTIIDDSRHESYMLLLVPEFDVILKRIVARSEGKEFDANWTTELLRRMNQVKDGSLKELEGIFTKWEHFESEPDDMVEYFNRREKINSLLVDITYIIDTRLTKLEALGMDKETRHKFCTKFSKHIREKKIGRYPYLYTLSELRTSVEHIEGHKEIMDGIYNWIINHLEPDHRLVI